MEIIDFFKKLVISTTHKFPCPSWQKFLLIHVMRISLLIKIIQSKQSNPKSTKEMGFQLKLLEKAYFIVKMTGLAMVQLASSDFWNVL